MPASIIAWHREVITVIAPRGLDAGGHNVVVDRSGTAGAPRVYETIPWIDTMRPLLGVAGETVVLTGDDFGDSAGEVQIGGVTTSVVS
jgi:hypothetical protein